MARCIRVLCTESRTECINCAERRRCQLALKLTGHGQTRLLAEEIAVIDYAAVLVLLEVVQIHCRDLEHLPCTFTVRSRNERSMEIIETLVMEELVDSVRHIVADAEHCAKGVCSRTQMRYCTHELHCLSLLLQRICIVTCTQELYLCRLDLH